jgi:hypothetical protein
LRAQATRAEAANGERLERRLRGVTIARIDLPKVPFDVTLPRSMPVASMNRHRQ